jgi:hypothetical protein
MTNIGIRRRDMARSILCRHGAGIQAATVATGGYKCRRSRREGQRRTPKRRPVKAEPRAIGPVAPLGNGSCQLSVQAFAASEPLRVRHGKAHS